MKRLLRTVGIWLKWGTLISTACFIGCILIQIYARFFMATAPSWTEEAARMFFVFAIGFSSGLALKTDYYVHFDFLYRRFSPAWQRWLESIIDVFTVVLFGVFVLYSLRFVGMGWAESSPSLRFPMAIPFAGMLVMGASLLFYAVIRVLRHRQLKAPRE